MKLNESYTASQDGGLMGLDKIIEVFEVEIKGPINGPVNIIIEG